MASLLTALLTLACLCAGTVLGSLIRSRLPDHHLRDDSRDVVKMASGMIATLVALVIGLLVSSSKSTYDQASYGVTQIGAKMNCMSEKHDINAPRSMPPRLVSLPPGMRSCRKSSP